MRLRARLSLGLFLILSSSFALARQCDVPEPVYPDDVSLHGTANVRIYIDEEGAITKTEIEKSSGSDLLDKSALEAARKIKCKPFLENGKPVKAKAVQPYVFLNSYVMNVDSVNNEIIKIIKENPRIGIHPKIAARMGCSFPESRQRYTGKVQPNIKSVIVRITTGLDGRHYASSILRGSDSDELNQAALKASKLVSCPLKQLSSFVYGYHFE
jgi:TonB family protein